MTKLTALCLQVCPKGVANRVNLGLIPTSRLSWEIACAALKRESGGMLHVHENVTSHMAKNQTVLDVQAEQRNSRELNAENREHHTAEHTKKVLKFAKKPKCRPEWQQTASDVCSNLRQVLQRLHANRWRCDVTHIEHVKSYAPHVDHVVFDIRCLPVFTGSTSR